MSRRVTVANRSAAAPQNVYDRPTSGITRARRPASFKRVITLAVSSTDRVTLNLRPLEKSNRLNEERSSRMSGKLVPRASARRVLVETRSQRNTRDPSRSKAKVNLLVAPMSAPAT